MQLRLLRRRDINKISPKNEQQQKSIHDNHKGLPVAVHYNQADHSINDLSYVILNGNFTIIHKLNTYKRGLNRDFGFPFQLHVFQQVITSLVLTLEICTRHHYNHF